MILTLDIGNTRIKSAVFENFNQIDFAAFYKNELQKNIEIILKKHPKITNLVVSSVAETEKTAFESFEKRLKIHFVSHKDIFPFQNSYKTPQTLGIDRMVLATGATLLFPNTNRLVIDAGTCVTYDFIDENNIYHGGAISLGLKMRYKALNHYTAKLPLLEVEDSFPVIGKSTSESIHSGVINGLCYEIEGFIEHYKSLTSNFIIILTGGDTDFLAKRLKNTIFANSNFLLESLNQLFQYSIKE